MEKKLEEIAPDSNDHVIIPAIDDKKDSTGLICLNDVALPSKRPETAGMHTILVLALGAKVMLIHNVDTSDGLVNGVIGTVKAIKTNAAQKVIAVLVEFDNSEVGKLVKSSSQWKTEYPVAVPVTRREGKYENTGKKGDQVSRYQFPLTLAWAVTIHKCQGLTLENIVVSMKGSKRFENGQAYV